MTIQQFVVALYGVAFISGVVSTMRLWKKYRRAGVILAATGDRNDIGLAAVVIAALITIGIAVLEGGALQRMLGFDPWLAGQILAILFSIPILFVPLILDVAFEYVSRHGPPGT